MTTVTCFIDDLVGRIKAANKELEVLTAAIDRLPLNVRIYDLRCELEEHLALTDAHTQDGISISQLMDNLGL